MSQTMKPKTDSDKSSDKGIRKGTVWAATALIAVGLIVVLVGLFAYDRTVGSWGSNNDEVGSTRSREVMEPGTLQYGGSNAFPRTDPIR